MTGYDRLYNEQRRQKGVCLRCGKPRNPNSVRACDQCLDLDRERHKPKRGRRRPNILRNIGSSLQPKGKRR